MEKFCGKMCTMHKNPVNCLLHVVAAIIVIYALWQHSITLILVGFLIAVVGHIIQASTVKKIEEKGEKGKGKREGKKGTLELKGKKFSGFAIAGFILSFFGVGILGIIFSAIGLHQTRNGEKRGRGLAIAGLIIGIISLILSLLLLSFWLF